MTTLGDHGPVLTPAEAAALHDDPEPVAWFVLPAPSGNGVIARAHTEAHNGGWLLLGHLAANDLDELRAMLPPGLHRGTVGWQGRRWGAWNGGGVDTGFERLTPTDLLTDRVQSKSDVTHHH